MIRIDAGQSDRRIDAVNRLVILDRVPRRGRTFRYFGVCCLFQGGPKGISRCLA